MTQFWPAAAATTSDDHMRGRFRVATIWSPCLSSNPRQLEVKVNPPETAVGRGIINTSEKAFRPTPMVAPRCKERVNVEGPSHQDPASQSACSEEIKKGIRKFRMPFPPG